MFDVCLQVYVKMQDITRYPAKIKELVAAVKTKAGIKSTVSPTPCKFSSRWYLCAWKGPYELHPTLRSSPNVAFETIPVLV